MIPHYIVAGHVHRIYGQVAILETSYWEHEEGDAAIYQ